MKGINTILTQRSGIYIYNLCIQAYEIQQTSVAFYAVAADSYNLFYKIN